MHCSRKPTLSSHDQFGADICVSLLGRRAISSQVPKRGKTGRFAAGRSSTIRPPRGIARRISPVLARVISVACSRALSRAAAVALARPVPPPRRSPQNLHPAETVPSIDKSLGKPASLPRLYEAGSSVRSQFPQYGNSVWLTMNTGLRSSSPNRSISNCRRPVAGIAKCGGLTVATSTGGRFLAFRVVLAVSAMGQFQPSPLGKSGRCARNPSFGSLLVYERKSDARSLLMPRLPPPSGAAKSLRRGASTTGSALRLQRHEKMEAGLSSAATQHRCCASGEASGKAARQVQGRTACSNRNSLKAFKKISERLKSGRWRTHCPPTSTTKSAPRWLNAPS